MGKPGFALSTLSTVGAIGFAFHEVLFEAAVADAQPTIAVPTSPPVAPPTPPLGGGPFALPFQDDVCSTACATSTDCKTAERCRLGCCEKIQLKKSKAKATAQQQSPVTRSGHELLTRLAGERALDGVKQKLPLTGDSRCKRSSCSYGSEHHSVFSAIMGVRWADLMGFRAGPLFPAQQRCLSSVAQDNEEVQYDHALRMRTDAGPVGGLHAIEGIRQRLTERFVAAVVADDDAIDIADGGAAQDHFRVMRSFFLLGRALHIVQDSFSTYHMARVAPSFREITQVNSYVCTAGAPQHPHDLPGVLDLITKGDSSNGDAIRRSGCNQDTLACLKSEYVASVDASAQLWQAFTRATSNAASDRAQAAHREIHTYLETWFTVPHSVPDVPIGACSIESVAKIEARRQACLREIGSNVGNEPPFDWHKASFQAIP